MTRHRTPPENRDPSGPNSVAAARELSLLSVWPLVELAVRCSQDAYDGHAFRSAQQLCTVLERVKISNHSIKGCGHVTVVAVSGTRRLADWIVNVNGWASEPEGVLGTSSNLCHTGYLQVVRRLLAPLAAVLSDYKRSSTVLFTGHSSGAAIASLLYAHVKTTNDTALAELSREFGAVHCVVFGAPPISVCPLQDQRAQGEDGQDSLFLSLLNEEDPIVDADVGALAERYARPILAWASTCRSRLSSSILAVPQRNQAFVLSGTILSIGAGPDGLLRFHTQGRNEAEPRRSATPTWTAHRLVVYRERIASLHASMAKCLGSTVGAFEESTIVTHKQACSGGTLPRPQACLLVMSCAWVVQLVIACTWLAFCISANSSMQAG